MNGESEYSGTPLRGNLSIMDTYCITPDQRIPSLQWKIFVDPDGVCLRGGPLLVKVLCTSTLVVSCV